MESFQNFAFRHIGPKDEDLASMLREIGYRDRDSLLSDVIPASIRVRDKLRLPPPTTEKEALIEIRSYADKNELSHSFIGMGFSESITPAVILRNVFENPGWLTSYTPYQAEISQGRLEALLNFQTMIAELTGLPVANASLLDEATAAAEAMTLCRSSSQNTGADTFLISAHCHPRTIDVVKGRADPLGIQIKVLEPKDFTFDGKVFGVLLQYPESEGKIQDPTSIIASAHKAGALVAIACDLLSLALLKPPGELGADVAIGNSQRFGIPLGYGGPHAAFFATKEEWKRLIPGRIVGVSKDASGKTALRLALQTREQHIRREKATSNICTAQALLAIMASFYAVYHGPEGIHAIAARVHALTLRLFNLLQNLKIEAVNSSFFDTLTFQFNGKSERDRVLTKAEKSGYLLRSIGDSSLGITLGETNSESDVYSLASLISGESIQSLSTNEKSPTTSGKSAIPNELKRTSPLLTHPVFHRYRSETEVLRYIDGLEKKDISLTDSMIPLGSCTMKLNATSELLPVSFAGFSSIHPFAPPSQTDGYDHLFRDLEHWIGEITGFDAVSLEPNSGSQGEFAGLLVIRKFLASRGESHRGICLIPRSAHGTNPASAVMAGFRVVAVDCDTQGNVEIGDLRKKAQEHSQDLGAFMITYPSTHGVFEEGIEEICAIIHEHGGQVYMDGANLNAQVGLCRPGDFGPDVCHLNLHKTFCIPHGGGGPGMGPIAVKKHLAPFLPSKGKDSILPVSGASHGSASILPISWMYIRMMGEEGLKRATEAAIINANYLAEKLDSHFPVLYRGARGRIAHECILDLRPFKATSGVEVEDVAKRLMDYGFHAPTISFPVPGTLMIEPTESESKEELDRFIAAMIAIRGEIREIEEKRADSTNNLLKNAPHTADVLISDSWNRPYSREKAAFPLPWVRVRKYWPPVSRIDNAYGDRNLVCTCPPWQDE